MSQSVSVALKVRSFYSTNTSLHGLKRLGKNSFYEKQRFFMNAFGPRFFLPKWTRMTKAFRSLSLLCCCEHSPFSRRTKEEGEISSSLRQKTESSEAIIESLLLCLFFLGSCCNICAIAQTKERDKAKRGRDAAQNCNEAFPNYTRLKNAEYYFSFFQTGKEKVLTFFCTHVGTRKGFKGERGVELRHIIPHWATDNSLLLLLGVSWEGLHAVSPSSFLFFPHTHEEEGRIPPRSDQKQSDHMEPGGDI